MCRPCGALHHFPAYPGLTPGATFLTRQPHPSTPTPGVLGTPVPALCLVVPGSPDRLKGSSFSGNLPSCTDSSRADRTFPQPPSRARYKRTYLIGAISAQIRSRVFVTLKLALIKARTTELITIGILHRPPLRLHPRSYGILPRLR